MYLDKNYIIAELPEKLSDDIISWAYDFISNDIIYRENDFYGIVHNIHVTVLSDLRNTHEKYLKEIIQSINKFECVLGETKMFTTNSKFNVLYIEVLNDDIILLNEKLNNLIENDCFYKKYIPHVTICYLNKDSGENLSNDNYFNGRVFQVNDLIYSSPETRTKFKLGT